MQNTWRPTRLLSAGGNGLCYKHCRTPLPLKRKIASHFRMQQKWLDKSLVLVQETETMGEIFLKWRQSLALSQVEAKVRVWIFLPCISSPALGKNPPIQDQAIIHFFPWISRYVQGTTRLQTFLLSLLVSQNLHLAVFEYECFLWLFCGSFSKYSKQLKNT